MHDIGREVVAISWQENNRECKFVAEKSEDEIRIKRIRRNAREKQCKRTEEKQNERNFK